MMIKRSMCMALSLALAACQADPTVDEDMQQALKDREPHPSVPAPPAPPPEVNQALLPPLTNQPIAPVARDNRFDIAVKDAAAPDFFMGLVEGSSYNMMVEPGVSGKITLTLKNVTVPEVMEAVRNVYGYEYSYHDGIFEVMPNGLVTRVFPINYLNLKRLGTSRTRVNSGQLTESGNGSSGGGGNSGSNNNNTGNNGGGTVEQMPSTEISTDTDADLWKELQTTLHTLVGEGEGRQVIASPQTGMVIVKASVRELAIVDDFLTRAQLSLQRQVVLEAKILEVTLSDGFQSGINWSRLGSMSGHPLGVGMSNVPLAPDPSASTTNAVTGAIIPQPILPSIPGKFATATTTAASALGGVFAGAYTGTNFDGVIELLQTQGSVQVLSSPRVSTVNNQKAVIKVGSDEFFVTSVSTTTNSTSSGTTSTPNVTLTPFFSGIALDVTPQISEEGDITLHVHPSVNKVVDQEKQFKVFNQDFELPLAFSTSRETDSIVRAKNGQVVVIGGLMQNNAQDTQAGVPGLSKIPLLGYLFKQKQNSTSKTELVILLRPVVPDDGGWDEQVRAIRSRFDELHSPMPEKLLP
jgi:MSHA biogenesis protein MshL